MSEIARQLVIGEVAERAGMNTSRIRYWNTGSCSYEPELSSPEAYTAYLRNAWPGTAVLIDSEASEPRLLRLREHLNPLHR